MEEDPNLICTLTAISEDAKQAFQESHNSRFYVPQASREIAAAASRESTPATNVGDEDDVGDGSEDRTHRLQLTFNRKPRNIDQGFVFGGSKKTCDVVLGSPNIGISSSHFRITFDEKDRLVLIDSSTLGTAVSYDGQGGDEDRKNPHDRKQNRPRDRSNDFSWILFPNIDNKHVIITGPKGRNGKIKYFVKFLVEVADPKTHSYKNQYRELQKTYLEEMRTAIPLSLNIHSHLTTAGQTESHSPTQRPKKQRPIWIDHEEIGRGEFGTVYRAVNVSTGVIYAAKTFQGNNESHRERWLTEIALLRKVSHDHIVEFVDHDAERERPRLIMEYLPLGNLAEQNEIWRITEWETVTLLCQGLSALSYLHPKNIVHRDLKPQNILVQCREPGNFCIKIADFGLARDGSYLKTFCGTWLYAAPEIWKNRPYTAMVDIWSLGIIAFQYAYDLPKIPKVQGQFDPKRWYQRLTCLIDDWDSDGLLELLKSSMLRMDPRDRLSASECLRESAKLRETIIPAQNSELDPGTPTEAMPSSAIMRALRAAGYGGGQQVVADEAEIQTNLPTLSILKSARQPGGDRGNPEMAVGEVGTLLDFPTLPTLRSSCRPEDCPETITQIWDPPGEAACRPKEDEGSKQEVEIGTGDESGMRRSKRQRMEQPSDELLPNSQQKHWKRYEDQVLIEDLSSGCIRMVLEGKAVSLRKSDCWLNATQVLGLAASPAKDRNRILSILRQRTNIQVVRNPPQLWIPYQDGRFLCEFLQLTDTLRPLLKYGLKQGVNFDDQANYFSNPKFLEVTAGKTTVSIRSADFWINATHILKAAGCHRYEMAKVRKRVQFNVVRGNAASQGTYVDPRTGLGLCKEYGLDSLESILRSHLEGYGYRQGELRQPATTTQNPTTVEVTASLGARRDRRKKTAVRDDRPNKTRPRCNKCTEYHRKCDRSDICGCCNALGLDCIYGSKIAGRRPRLRAEPVKGAEPRQLLKRLHEDKDLNAKMQQIAEISPQENGDSFDRSAKDNTSTRLDEKTDGETNRETNEEISEETGEEKLSQYSSDKRFPAATNYIQKIIDDQNRAGSDDSPAVSGSLAKRRRSNLTELSFGRGSFLPPIRESFLHAKRQQHQSSRDSSSDFAVRFDDEALWIDVAIKDSLRGSSGVAQHSPWHGG